MNELRLILIGIGVILLVIIYWAGRREQQQATRYDAPPNNKNSASVTDHASIYHRPRQEFSINTDDFDTDEEHIEIQKTYVHMGGGNTPLQSNNGSAQQESIVASEEFPPIIDFEEELVDPDLFSITKNPDYGQELPPGVEPKVIALTVMAGGEHTFDPGYLKESLESLGLQHGEMNIYHYYRNPRLEANVVKSQRLFSVANAVEPGYFSPTKISSYSTSGVSFFLQLPVAIDGVLAFEKMHQTAETLAKRMGGFLCDDKYNKLTSQAVHHIKDQISEYNLKLRSGLKRSVH